MAWKNGYYYRNRRVGGKVTSEYVGSGYQAELAAELDEHERAQAELQRRAFEEIQKREDAIDAQIDGIGVQVKALVAAHLIVSGHHQHRREWRKKRD